MSDAIDYIALQKSKAIQYMVAKIMDETCQNNLTLGQTVELAIKRGMEYQDNLDYVNKWSGATRAAEGFKDAHSRDDWNGYQPHDSLELHIDENGMPYYGIAKNIQEN